MTITAEQATKMLEGTTPDWTVYSELEVGLPPSLFAGVPGREGFAPLEPLQGRDLNLAQAAPDLAAALIASEAARKLAEERLAKAMKLQHLHAEALSEIKATVDGQPSQPVKDIVYGLLQEIKENDNV